MNAIPPYCTETFKLVARGLIALHQLDADGRDESPEAEAIRDSLDFPLRALNRAEDERGRWLSEDLYSTHEPAEPAGPHEMDIGTQRRLDGVFAARQNKDWDLALLLLRGLREEIPMALLSYLRGTVWLEMGMGEVAEVFFGHERRTLLAA